MVIIHLSSKLHFPSFIFVYPFYLYYQALWSPVATMEGGNNLKVRGKNQSHCHQPNTKDEEEEAMKQNTFP